MDCINLITPPSSPRKRKASAPPDSDSSDCELLDGPARDAGTSQAGYGLGEHLPQPSDAGTSHLDSDSDECEVVQPAPAPPAAEAAAGAAEDEDLSIVGTTGAFALSDFPHSRENCATKPFVLGSGTEAMHCSNCYCFVCDAPASTCGSWAVHCKAVHSDPAWRARRAQRAAAAVAAASAPPAPGAASSSAASSTAAVRARGARAVCALLRIVFTLQSPRVA